MYASRKFKIEHNNTHVRYYSYPLAQKSNKRKWYSFNSNSKNTDAYYPFYII